MGICYTEEFKRDGVAQITDRGYRSNQAYIQKVKTPYQATKVTHTTLLPFLAFFYNFYVINCYAASSTGEDNARRRLQLTHTGPCK